MEDQQQQQQQQQQQEDEAKKQKKSIIQIPSYQQVYGGSSNSAPKPYNPPPPSFSQAFSYLKSSEFYTSPPPPPPQSAPRNDSQSQSPAQTSTSSSATAVATTSQQNRNAILVSHRQKGNPLLKHIRNVRWTFADIVCDYLLGQSSCALYISLRYHLLHPDYLYFRIRELQKNFKLRVVLCHVDVEDVVKPLHEITKTSMLHDCTLLCGWSLEECGRYLETIKVYENKSADTIREHPDADYLSRLTHALTSVRRVNKTDVVTLGSTFGSLSRIMDASMEDLARCPGIGERKVRRLYDTFHEPFRRVSSRPTIAASEESTKDKSVEEPSLMDDSTAVEKSLEASKDEQKCESQNVKSALTAAFSKYSDRVGKREGEGKGKIVEKGEGSSNVTSKE